MHPGSSPQGNHRDALLMPHVSRGIGILAQSMVLERRALVTSLALQLEKICLRRIIFAVPKVAQPDAN